MLKETELLLKAQVRNAAGEEVKLILKDLVGRLFLVLHPFDDGMFDLVEGLGRGRWLVFFAMRRSLIVEVHIPGNLVDVETRENVCPHPIVVVRFHYPIAQLLERFKPRNQRLYPYDPTLENTCLRHAARFSAQQSRNRRLSYPACPTQQNAKNPF